MWRNEDELLMESMSEGLRLIAGAVGIEGALKVAQLLGGETLYIPAMDELQRMLRDERIRRERAGGMSVRSLSLRHGVTTRTVYNVLKKRPSEVAAILERLVKDMGKP